jgi:chromosomal replication initiator protein
MVLSYDTKKAWVEFLTYIEKKTSPTAFGNWFAPIRYVKGDEESITLEVPNIFVKEYLISNYKEEMKSFLPVDDQGELSIQFVVAENKKIERSQPQPQIENKREPLLYEVHLNSSYRFDTFIEGPNNQFVKSAALGVAARPGVSYNPLFIHGGVGLGKTHLLHSIGHFIGESKKPLRVHCITTEAFVNDLVDSLKNKSLDKLKKFYRQEIDVLLIDDIQFLQNRLNFEEELCNLFEALKNQNKQIVITSDKPPSQLRLSERMIARMEWGLVAQVGVPELETRVAILQHKAQKKGLEIPQNVAFFIAEHIYNNVRQLEGAINRLSAHCRLLDMSITEELVKNTLKEMLQHVPTDKISIEQILKCVAAVFQVSIKALKGSERKKEVALPRQVAMYLAKRMINDSLQVLGASFGKTHSTIIHAYRNIEKKVEADEELRRQIGMIEREIRTA